MMKHRFIYLALALVCTSPATLRAEPAGRWYTADQVTAGKSLYAQHCASCHGRNGEGANNWRKRDAKGNFPPPPLNGTAHTWHHPLNLLRSIIDNGGAPVGGVMPPFRHALDNGQRDAIIAWFQSMWNDETYANWLKLGGLSRDR